MPADALLWVFLQITINGTETDIRTTPMTELACKRLAYDLSSVKAEGTKQVRHLRCYGPNAEKWAPVHHDGSLQRDVRP